MNKKLDCPVCSFPLEHHEDYMGSTLMEAEDKCRVCGFNEEYVNGSVRIIIGGHELIYGYHDSERKVARILRLVKAYAPTARKLFIAKIVRELEDWRMRYAVGVLRSGIIIIPFPPRRE